jgi:uncharacterized membrane protein YfcA
VIGPWQVAAFLGCVALASWAQGITGFALALILLGLTSLFDLAPLPDVANVATVLSLASATIALRGTRRAVDWPIWRSTVAGSVLGYAAGVAVMGWLNANVVTVLRLLLGLVVIACAVIVLVRTEPLAQRSSAASFRGFGFLSGVLGGLFSASGPPLVYQFYRQPLTLDVVRDTLVAALATGALIRLGMVVPTGQFTLQSLLLCLVSVPLAMSMTWWLRKHPPAWPRATVLKIVCALLTVTGVGLVVPALRKLLA